MHEILNFAQALNPNAAYTRFRNTTARAWENLRVTEEGFLETMKGHTPRYEDEAISVRQTFLYNHLMIIVADEGTDGRLGWAEITEEEQDVEPNWFDDEPTWSDDMTPRIRAYEGGPYQSFSFQVIDNATGQYIFMGNGNSTNGVGSQYVIDLDGVFDGNTLQAPTVSAYLFQEAPPHIVVEPEDSAIVTDELKEALEKGILETVYIKVKTQVVQRNSEGGRIAISEPSNASDAIEVNALQMGKTTDDIIAAHIRVGGDPDDNVVRAIITILKVSSFLTGTNKGLVGEHGTVDIFITAPYDPDDIPDADTEFLPYYKIDSIPNKDLGHEPRGVVIPLNLDDIDSNERLVLGGDLLPWKYIEQDSVRFYAMNPRDESRLHLSYFDGISERLYRNFNEFLTLPISGETVTGLKFLPDSPYLAVYTTRQIVIVLTDPNPELCRVVGQYGPLDRDEFVGCIAPDSLVAIGRYHYFLGGNKRVYRFSGRGLTWVSQKVQTLLNKIVVPDSFEPVHAYGFAHDGNYYLSFQDTPGNPMFIEGNIYDPMFVGEADAEETECEPQRLEPTSNDNLLPIMMGDDDQYLPNTTLILDVERAFWVSDSVGITSYVKTPTGRFYGVIRGNIYSLYDADNKDVPWEWESNRFLLPVQEFIYNLNVKTLDKIDPEVTDDITVTATTETYKQTCKLSIQTPDDYYGQRANLNLRGRTLGIKISGKGPVTIDRLTINERARRINRR